MTQLGCLISFVLLHPVQQTMQKTVKRRIKDTITCLLSLNTIPIPIQADPHSQYKPTLEAVVKTTVREAENKLPTGSMSWLFQPSKKFHLKPTYCSASLGDSKAQRLCLLGKVLSEHLLPFNSWARTSSHVQEKLLISFFLAFLLQCTWGSVLPNHFSLRTSSCA